MKPKTAPPTAPSPPISTISRSGFGGSDTARGYVPLRAAVRFCPPSPAPGAAETEADDQNGSCSCALLSGLAVALPAAVEEIRSEAGAVHGLGVDEVDDGAPTA